MNKLPISSICAAISTTVLCVYLFKNLKLEQSKLFVSLNQTFYNDSDFQTLLDDIDNKSLSEKDLGIASRCFDFFEPFDMLIKRRQLSMSQVDNMFAYRFFSIVNEKQLQEELLTPHYNYYRNICALHHRWSEYRKLHGYPLLRKDSDLSLTKWYANLYN